MTNNLTQMKMKTENINCNLFQKYQQKPIIVYE